MNDWLPIIGVLIAVLVVWKLFKGVIKLVVIVALLAFAAWFLFGNAA